MIVKNCDFAKLTIDERVILSFKSMVCTRCGTENSQQDVDAVYKGHNEKGEDAFKLIGVFKCKYCGNQWTIVTVPCSGPMFSNVNKILEA